MEENLKERIDNFYLQLEKINLEIQKLEKSKTELYSTKTVFKKELQVYYNYMIGKKAKCITENGTNIYECNAVLINDDFKPLPKFKNDKDKKVTIIDFDWL